MLIIFFALCLILRFDKGIFGSEFTCFSTSSTSFSSTVSMLNSSTHVITFSNGIWGWWLLISGFCSSPIILECCCFLWILEFCRSSCILECCFSSRIISCCFSSWILQCCSSSSSSITSCLSLWILVREDPPLIEGILFETWLDRLLSFEARRDSLELRLSNIDGLSCSRYVPKYPCLPPSLFLSVPFNSFCFILYWSLNVIKRTLLIFWPFVVTYSWSCLFFHARLQIVGQL